MNRYKFYYELFTIKTFIRYKNYINDFYSGTIFKTSKTLK